MPRRLSLVDPKTAIKALNLEHNTQKKVRKSRQPKQKLNNDEKKSTRSLFGDIMKTAQGMLKTPFHLKCVKGKKSEKANENNFLSRSKLC